MEVDFSKTDLRLRASDEVGGGCVEPMLLQSMRDFLLLILSFDTLRHRSLLITPPFARRHFMLSVSTVLVFKLMPSCMFRNMSQKKMA